MSTQHYNLGITPALFFFLVSTERRGRAHRGQQLPPAGLQDHGMGGRHPGRVLCLQQDPAQGEGLRPRGVGPLLMLTSNICVAFGKSRVTPLRSINDTESAELRRILYSGKLTRGGNVSFYLRKYKFREFNKLNNF